MKTWTEEEDKLLVKHYSNTTRNELLALFNDRKIGSLISRAFKLKLSKPKNKYNHNKLFFNKVNILSSYWAGFIAADGSIRTKLNQLNIGLSTNDKHHLEVFCKYISYNGPIHDKVIIKNKPTFKKKKYYASYLYVCGAKQVISDLNTNYNIRDKKSLVLTPPKHLNKINTLAFIVGLIDGDGTIRCTKDNRLEFSIVGTKEILTWIKNRFDKLCPSKTKFLAQVRHRKDRTKKNHFVYKITGFRAKAILDKLLQLELPRLSRKWSNVNISTKPKYRSNYVATVS